MRDGTRVLGWLLAAGLLSAAVPAGAQEMLVPKPTKEHQLLTKDAGKWEATIKSYIDPKEPPAETKGTETNTVLPGGLWLISAFEGYVGGAPFHGHGQNGYDPLRRMYVSTWVDSFGTSPTIMEGTYDESKKTLTMLGETVDPAGIKGFMKIVTTYKPGGGRSAAFFMKRGETGPEFLKFMEIEYTKKAE